MTLSTILLIGLYASVLSVVVFGCALTCARYRSRLSAASSLGQAYDVYRAVMTVWYQAQLHLDELEQDGVEVTAFRQNMAATVEQLLTDRILNQFVEDQDLFYHRLKPQNTSPNEVGQFGSFRIFG